MTKESRHDDRARGHRTGARAASTGRTDRPARATSGRGGRAQGGRDTERARSESTPTTPPGREADVREARDGAQDHVDARQRIERDLDRAREQLRRLEASAETHESEARAEAGTLFEEGDAAQASERRDLTFMTRERLGDRIHRLVAALDRLRRGVYGTCEVCGEPIEPQRLAALPEAGTCLKCQQARERGEEAA